MPKVKKDKSSKKTPIGKTPTGKKKVNSKIIKDDDTKKSDVSKLSNDNNFPESLFKNQDSGKLFSISKIKQNTNNHVFNNIAPNTDTEDTSSSIIDNFKENINDEKNGFSPKQKKMILSFLKQNEKNHNRLMREEKKKHKKYIKEIINTMNKTISGIYKEVPKSHKQKNPSVNYYDKEIKIKSESKLNNFLIEEKFFENRKKKSPIIFREVYDFILKYLNKKDTSGNNVFETDKDGFTLLRNDKIVKIFNTEMIRKISIKQLLSGQYTYI